MPRKEKPTKAPLFSDEQLEDEREGEVVKAMRTALGSSLPLPSSGLRARDAEEVESIGSQDTTSGDEAQRPAASRAAAVSGRSIGSRAAAVSGRSVGSRAAAEAELDDSSDEEEEIYAASRARASRRAAGSGLAVRAGAVTGRARFLPSSSSSSLGSAAASPREEEYAVLRDGRRVPYATKDNINGSVVRVSASGLELDYEFPYRPPTTMSWKGSATIIEVDGELLVLTNGHVVGESTHLRLLRSNMHKLYAADVVFVQHECDLALVRPRDPKFFDGARPVKLSSHDIVPRGHRVVVKGFPVGGEEISETFGRVSRIQVDRYAHSMRENLNVQVDADINPGNSGGTAADARTGELVGVPFQGCNAIVGQGLGYIIPVCVVRHFLRDYLRHPTQRGFPELAVELQSIDDEYQRQVLGLAKEQAAMRVIKCYPLFSGTSLKAEDLIIAIDGKPLKDDGKLDYGPGLRRIDMQHAVSMKHLGDDLPVTVLRKNATGALEKHDLSVRLNNMYEDSVLVRRIRYDVKPTYAIESGFVFTPVSQNNFAQLGDAVVYKGASLECAPRKKPTDEVIYLCNVLASSETESFQKLEGHILANVYVPNAAGGEDKVAIENMPHLLATFARIPEGAPLKFETNSKVLVCVPKFTAARAAEVYEEYGVSMDRLVSRDLKPDVIDAYHLRERVLTRGEDPREYIARWEREVGARMGGSSMAHASSAGEASHDGGLVAHRAEQIRAGAAGGGGSLRRAEAVPSAAGKRMRTEDGVGEAEFDDDSEDDVIPIGRRRLRRAAGSRGRDAASSRSCVEASRTRVGSKRTREELESDGESSLDEEGNVKGLIVDGDDDIDVEALRGAISFARQMGRARGEELRSFLEEGSDGSSSGADDSEPDAGRPKAKRKKIG